MISDVDNFDRPISLKTFDILLEKAYAELRIDELAFEENEEEISILDSTILSLKEEKERIKSEIDSLNDIQCKRKQQSESSFYVSESSLIRDSC